MVAEAVNNYHTLSDDDGYTLSRFVKGRPRLHDSLRVMYRPIGAIQRAAYIDRRSQTYGEQATLEGLGKVLAKRIVSWDAKGSNGESLPVSVESVLSLHPMLLSRLCDIIVWSADGGDPDPESPMSSPSSSDDWDEDTDADLLDRSQKN